ncbi:MAG: SDR family NAD(P)-dependent oxidoreductase [Gelidibacter sp.]|uniref:SDR family NAD(P)-dependent oxidoreductase n=1 Tax=Gelidibacter sp. TaxID=2018083 RepID=UPI003264F84A
MNKHISIIGCGWLGFPLATELVRNGNLVKGSTTSPSKIEVLKKAGIIPFVVSISEEGITDAIEECLKDSEVLIINIPPGLRKNPKANFIKQMDLLSKHIEHSDIKKVLYVSSTSVYEEEVDIPTITDENAPNGQSYAAKQLIGAEDVFKNNPNFETTILRFGGLIGGDRNPAKYLSGKENAPDPEGPVNLIHQEDCIAIIKNIIVKEQWNTVFNAVAPQHPSREKYYNSLCEIQKLPLPHFDHATPSKGKIISSEKVERELHYVFTHKL